MFRKIGAMPAAIAATIPAIEMIGFGKHPIAIGIEIIVGALF